MKKILFLCITLSLCLVFLESPSYGFSLNISPPSFTASVKPGGSTSGTINVFNKGEKDIGIMAYVQDWSYNPDGSKSFLAAGTAPFSCAKWIRLFPKKFQLEAGGRMAVQYTITIPDEANGGYHAVIFFESVPVGKDAEEEGMMVRFSGRVGTIVYLETEGRSVRKGAIESLSISPPQSNKPLGVDLSFKNKGNVHIAANGTLNIIDNEGNVFGKEKFGPVNTLPEETREKKIEWLGDLEEGTYYGIVTLDIGAEEPIVKEKEFTVAYGGIVKAFSIDSSSGKPSFSVLIKNTGDLNINAGGTIDILTGNGEVIKTVNLKKLLIAPGKEKKLKKALQEDLPAGDYTAKAVISVGAKEFTKEEAFSIK